MPRTSTVVIEEPRKKRVSKKRQEIVVRKAPRKAAAPYKKRKPSYISAAGNALGGLAGTALGGPAGTAIGSFLGGKLGHLIEQITGFGDYSVDQNTIMDGGMSPPQIVNSVEKGGFIIRHREYIQDIEATTDFTNLTLPLNPGIKRSFPWLSQIAGNFDQYKWRGVVFEFKSTSSDAVLSSATSSALGTVSMATDYDAIDSPFTSKREMLNSMFANSSKPSISFIHPIECKSSITPMRQQYVRTGGGFPPNADPRMYDLGNFQIATEGMQSAGGIVGELWVTYEVEFFKQQVSYDSLADHFKLSAVAAGGWLGVGANSHPGDPFNTLQGKINDAGNGYTFPATVSFGKYLCTYSCTGTSAAAVPAVSLTVAHCTLQDIWNSTTSYLQAPAATVSTVTTMVQFVVELTGPNANIQFGTAVVPGGTVVGDFIVAQLPSEWTDFAI